MRNAFCHADPWTCILLGALSVALALLGPGLGRLMPTCLDGGASEFQTERVKPHPTLSAFPSQKRVFYPPV
jgi:hypothetical protein